MTLDHEQGAHAGSVGQGTSRDGEKTSVVQTVLQEAGLQHLCEGFGSLPIDTFRDLMIQDYEKYGVFDVEDKQALFKVVKREKEQSVHERRGLDREVGADVRLEREARTVDGEYRQPKGDDLLDDPLDDLLDDPLDKLLDDHGLGGAGLGLNLDLDDEPSFLDMEEESLNMVEDYLAGEDTLPGATGGVPGGAARASGSMPRVAGNGLAASGRSIPSLQSIQEIDNMPRIRVIVRKRPLNSKEEERGDIDVIHCDMKTSSLTVYEPKTKVDTTKYIETHDFKFDDVFDTDVDNDALYLQTVRPLISTVFNSGRGTCFAYGQTGSGKTYTMEPLPLRAAEDIFLVAQTVPEFRDITLHVSCFEIYGGKVFDLLGGRARLEVREDARRRVQVVGLKEVQIKCMDDLSRLCQHAACARSTGSTGANDESSRSHSVMTFAVKTLKAGGRSTSRMAEEERISRQVGVASSKSESSATVGKLSFIDLAGSERGADTYENDKQTRLEGAEINKSLLALKECIRALDMDAGHVPFRGSKLTSVLRDSFVGKRARTVMIANVSPCSSSCEHTLNTLRYADRVKEMKKDEGKKKSSSRRESMVDFGGVANAIGRLRSDSIAAKLMQSMDQKPTRPERPDVTTKIHAHRGTQSAESVGPHASAKGPTTAPTRVAHGRTHASDNESNENNNKDIVEVHRQHIEDVMTLIRREMELLTKRSSDVTPPTATSAQEYARELAPILEQQLQAITSLQAVLKR
mmetsp:Transcript_2395/g.7443  ORF Transcript_2395/g.7443 Transcript_2395/m.7443 type:complete len:746 (-) Transcript_2395:596-2833(-)